MAKSIEEQLNTVVKATLRESLPAQSNVFNDAEQRAEQRSTEIHKENMTDRKADRLLRKIYAHGFLIIMAIQLAWLNYYGWKYLFTHNDTSAVKYMISGTIVEVVSVITIITKSLFPSMLQTHEPNRSQE